VRAEACLPPSSSKAPNSWISLTAGGTIGLTTASGRACETPFYSAFIIIIKCVPIPDRLKRETRMSVLASRKCGVVILIILIINLFTSHFVPKGLAMGS
jgi:hypothetical protein